MPETTNVFDMIDPAAGYRRTFSRRYRCGFSLIELLVVIAIIALLTAIIVPLTAIAKERARRAVCIKHIQQFIIGTLTYAGENDEFLPPGHSEPMGPPGYNTRENNTPIIAYDTRDALVNILGTEKALRCPWLRKPFTDGSSWRYNEYGFLLGYNYLGGHKGTPWQQIGIANADWKSPLSRTDDPRLPLITELNAWTRGGEITFAPHGKRGPILEEGDSSNPDARGCPSEQIGAVGGNIGLLDGSASWKKMADMKIYRGSYRHGTRGCFAAW